jgi:hypothetical protein
MWENFPQLVRPVKPTVTTPVDPASPACLTAFRRRPPLVPLVNPSSTLVLDRVLRVLRPLVRLLLRHGVTYPTLAAALKRVFLDAAQAELHSRGMPRTDSAVTLLSGVHRRDVRALTRGATAAAADAPPARLGLAAEVVARWMHDPAYEGRPLPRSGEGSFDELVQAVSRDVRPRAVLDELLRLESVTEAGPTIVLRQPGFAPRRDFEELSWLFAQNLHDHASAAAANLAGEGNFLEQAVFVDQISAESATRLQRAAVQAWKQAFKTVMAAAQERFDHDAANTPPAGRDQRARFGVYFFSEPDASRTER